MTDVQSLAAGLGETERDMLLDFAGLEAGKVCGGAAMWEIAKGFEARGLMAGWPNSQITTLGREVAARLLKPPSIDQPTRPHKSGAAE